MDLNKTVKAVKTNSYKRQAAKLSEKLATKSNFKWSNVNAGIPQRSISGPLSFLIYINDLPNGLQSNSKLFRDDVSLFSTIQDNTTNTVSLSHDLA